ncbi:MAG: ParB/RepB/Spo0J family partition protein [Candidatus Magasanikbacteria bacterium]|nr:ParB/RepB/Spo0J family partition protein [Candidatus Magasanikbacteria bacterium]
MPLGKGLNSLIPQQKKSRKSSGKQTSVEELKNRIWHIPISEIVPNPEQPRKDFSHKDLEDLVVSIKEHGVLQPITVSEKTDGGYELIAGERRLRASEIAGLTKIPAIVRGATKQEKLELALIENIQRQNLNPIEEAFAFQRLMDEFNLKQKEVAERVGKNRSTIANIIRLLDLPDVIQKALIDGKISTGKAKALLSLKDEKEQISVFSSMMGDKVTVRDLEKTVAKKGAKSRKGSVRRDPNLLAQEEMIEDRLGTKVIIKKKGEKGSITISFYSNEEFKRLVDELS